MTLTLLLAVLAVGQAAGPRTEELSPTKKNGSVNALASTAGLTVNLAGDERALYAVSLNAGVWKSVDGKPWVQLPNSPACAWSIAVDSANPRHVVVGERNGLAKDIRLNRNGLWESNDAGKSWRYTFDPLCLPGCESQAITAVAFTSKGTLFVGTASGIGRRERGAKTLDFRSSPAGIGLVTGVAVAEHKVWARTRDRLLFSSDDGKSWTVKPFPRELNGVKVAFTSRGDAFALGATDDLAFTPFIPVPTPDNRNNVLYYDAKADRWQTQVLPTGNGTGLGGRRLARSFVLRDRGLADRVGERIQLFIGAGQEIHQALGINPDGTVRWDDAIQTTWGGPYTREPNDIHPDIWDVQIPLDYDPRAPRAWVACDGGVYRCVQKPGEGQTHMARMKWVTQNENYFTHHAHTITALPGPRLAYPTSDNDAWFRDAQGRWFNETYMGDVNFSVGDAANPSFAVLWRNIALAMCTAFGETPPPGSAFQEYDAIMLNPQLQFDGPTAFTLVQTLKNERASYPLGDALMLVTPPLKTENKDWKLQNVPGTLGRPMGGPVIIRNKAFAGSPDANVSKFQSWEVFARDLPEGTQGFWVAGGHADPTVCVAAVRNGRAKLFKKVGVGWKELRLRAEGKSYAALIGRPKKRLTARADSERPVAPEREWLRGLHGTESLRPRDANMEEPGFEPALGSMHGPVFLNPYDPLRLFVLTRGGVLSSADGGDTFVLDKTLTSLVTGSGVYPIGTGNLSGNIKDVVLAGRENSMATLTDMCFLRDDPRVVVASSPYTGVFVSLDSGRTWRDLTPLLPKPLSAVPSVAVADDAVYAIPYGRSLVRITGYRLGRWATFFERDSAGSIALRCANGLPPANAAVSFSVWNAGRDLVAEGRARTSKGGGFHAPQTPDGCLVQVRFAGDAEHAPSVFRYLASQGILHQAGNRKLATMR